MFEKAVYCNRKKVIILEKIACNILPIKYRDVEMLVSDNIFNVCR